MAAVEFTVGSSEPQVNIGHTCEDTDIIYAEGSEEEDEMVTVGVFRQYLAAFTGSLSVMTAGTSYGWISPLLVWFLSPQSELPMTSNQSSWVVALVEFGNLFTSIPFGILVGRWGRKPCLIGTGPVYIVSWILVLTTRSVYVLYVVRIIQGLAMGVIYTVLPLYLAEISAANIRGALSTFFEGMWYLGILFEYALGPYLSYQTFNFITLLIPVIFLLTFVWMPESPYFLLMNNNHADAARSLAWLRATNDIEQELEEMKESIKEEQDSNRSWRDLISTKADKKALMIVQIVVLTKFMSGISAVLSYSSQTFSTTIVSNISADEFTIVLGVLFFFTTILAGSLVDKAGRRPLLLISCVGCGLAEFSTGLYYYLDSNTSIDVSKYGWISFVCIIVYCVIFSIGLGPLVNTLKGEIFPSSTKGFGSGLTTMTDTISCFICLKMYQVVTDNIGVYFNFWVFSGFCFFGAVVIYKLVPETKGKTFSEIQQELCATKQLTNFIYTPVSFKQGIDQTI